MEIEVFRRFKTKLKVAVCDSVSSVAGECHAQGLIDKTYDDIVYQSLSPKDKATRLLDAAEKSISTDSANYEKFMDILNEELPSGCKKPLVDMSKMLKDMRESSEGVHTCTDGRTTRSSVVDVPRAPGQIRVSREKMKDVTYAVADIRKQEKIKDVTFAGTDVRKRYVSRSASADSGVSVGRSDSTVSDRSETFVKMDSIAEDLPPVEETPLQDEGETHLHDGRSVPSKSHRSSSLADKLYNYELGIRSLRCDAMQKEALEVALKDEITKLRSDLEHANGKKTKAEEMLREKVRELGELKRDLETEKDTVLSQVEEIDSLKSRLSSSEAEKEKLRSKLRERVRTYEREIDDLKDEIRDCQDTIKDLTHKLDRKNLETQLAFRRSNSMEHREEIDKKDAEIKAVKDRKNMYKLLFLCLLVVVLAMAFFIYLYRDRYCFLSAVGLF